MVYCLYPACFSSSNATCLLQAIKRSQQPSGKAARAWAQKHPLSHMLLPPSGSEKPLSSSSHFSLPIFHLKTISEMLLTHSQVAKIPTCHCSLSVSILWCFHSSTGEQEISQEGNSCSCHHEYYGLTHKNRCWNNPGMQQPVPRHTTV